MQTHVENYDAETFWEELASRLAIRDAAAQVGRDEFGSMEPEARLLAISEHEERWLGEFADHGLQRITASTASTSDKSLLLDLDTG